MKKFTLFVFLGVLVVSAIHAQAPTVTVDEVACLPLEENEILNATVNPEVGGSSVRLYFRRLNPVGDFYYSEMDTPGGGMYWSPFPKPEDREQPELTDEWWDVLKDRDWMEGHDREWLENLLEEQENEFAEYYVAVKSATGESLSRSKFTLTPVLEQDDCEVELTERQDGMAENMTIGETIEEQEGREVFHWLCDGIVTRIDIEDILRADEFCRACVIAWPPAVIPLIVSAGIVSAALIEDEEPEPASPTTP